MLKKTFSKVVIAILFVLMLCATSVYAEEHQEQEEKTPKTAPGTAIFVMSSLDEKIDMNTVHIDTKKIETKDKYLDTVMEIPVFSGFSDKKFESKLNKSIEKQLLEKRNKFREFMCEFIQDAKNDSLNTSKARYTSSFKVIKSRYPYCTIALYEYSYNGLIKSDLETRYLNINVLSNKVVNLSDLFINSMSYDKILTNLVTNTINEKENLYGSIINYDVNIIDTQSFFIDISNNLNIIVTKHDENGEKSTTVPVKIPMQLLQNYTK